MSETDDLREIFKHIFRINRQYLVHLFISFILLERFPALAEPFPPRHIWREEETQRRNSRVQANNDFRSLTKLSLTNFSKSKTSHTYQFLLTPPRSFTQLLELGVGIMDPGLQYSTRLPAYRGLLYRHTDGGETRDQAAREGLAGVQPAVVDLLDSGRWDGLVLVYCTVNWDDSCYLTFNLEP